MSLKQCIEDIVIPKRQRNQVKEDVEQIIEAKETHLRLVLTTLSHMEFEIWSLTQ